MNGWNMDFVSLKTSKREQHTVVSAWSHPGYKPSSASDPLGEFPDDFAYLFHSKVSLYITTGYKNKPPLAPIKFPKQP